MCEQMRPNLDQLVSGTSAEVEENTEENNGQGFKKYKFIFSKTRDNADCIQLSVISFYSNEQLIKPATVENPAGRSPYNEHPAQLLKDSVYLKWLDSNIRYTRQSELIFTFKKAVQIDAYEFFTANDFLERDPVTWELYGGDGSQWKLLDKRTIFYAPLERYTSYGIVELNFGTETEPEMREDIKVDERPYLTRSRLALKSSQDVIQTWANSEFTCDEYKKAKDMMIVKHSLLSQSKLGAALVAIDKLLADNSLTEDFDTVLIRAISTAYGCSKRKAKNQRCMLGGYILHRSISQIYHSFSWRQPYLQFCLQQVISEDESALIGVLNILARGGSECKARKLMAFNSVCQRIAYSKSLLQELQEEMEEDVEPCIAIIREYLDTFIDDFKTKAFKSAFLEPTKVYFHCVCDYVMEGDVEVHGANTYAAVLLSTLGIKLPIIPYLQDDIKGCCAFLRCKALAPVFQEMLEKENFGKEWRKWPSCRADFVPNRQFVFSELRTVISVANLAISGDKNHNKQRKEIAKYCERFAYFFSPEFFFEKAIMALIGDSGHPDAVDQVFEILQKKELAKKEEKMANIDENLCTATRIYEWLYDVDDDYSFSASNAYKFFDLIGIVK